MGSWSYDVTSDLVKNKSDKKCCFRFGKIQEVENNAV